VAWCLDNGHIHWWFHVMVFKHFVIGFVGCFLVGFVVINEWFSRVFLWWFFNYVLMVTNGGSFYGFSMV
jgi:hypothetical protein